MKKKRRKTTPRERALVRAANEVIRIFCLTGRCIDCWRDDDIEPHDETCIVTLMKRALRVR